jgi:serine/threonine protein kinase
LPKATINKKDLEEKVKREIRFSKYFRHPNIIHLYEVIETKSEIILIMEYASGGELFDLLCQEIVINKIYNKYINYFYSQQKKKHVVYSNK